MFGIGIVELALALSVGLVGAVMRALRLPQADWLLVAAACLLVAACLTPADPASTLIMGAVMLTCFVIGGRFRSSHGLS